MKNGTGREIVRAAVARVQNERAHARLMEARGAVLDAARALDSAGIRFSLYPDALNRDAVWFAQTKLSDRIVKAWAAGERYRDTPAPSWVRIARGLECWVYRASVRGLLRRSTAPVPWKGGAHA